MLNANGFKFPTNGHKLMLQLAAGLTAGAVLGLMLFNLISSIGIVGPILGPPQALQRFTSYEELKNFLNKTVSLRADVVKAYTFNIIAEVSTDFSQTNVQVAGVDEADIVKSDGEYIYYVTKSGLIIVKAYPPENARVMSKISFNETVSGIFVNNDRLVVFKQNYGSPIFETKGVPVFYPAGGPETQVQIYNIENRESPILVREISINGSYFASRMIGNYVYLVVYKPAFLADDEVPLPVIKDGNRSEEVSISKIYYSNVTDAYYSFTVVLSFDIMNDTAPRYEVFLVGAAGAIYMSKENLYVTIQQMPFRILLGGPATSEKTEIHRIRITNGEIKYEASGIVPGRVLNQFSMDEYNGYFRIATTTGFLARNINEATTSNHVYVLDTNLNITGKIEDIAQDETIYSARFMDERCYLVTFKKVDPFFVIDLSSPANPQILGKLKIPGYSNYLHPYDKNHVIGIGKETVEAEEGDFAWYQGIKISLFDVSDVENPIEVDKYVIGHRGTDSPVLQDHKALLFDKKRNLLAIPVLVAEIDPNKYSGKVPSSAYGEYVWQGAYVFSITENGISLRGKVTHVKDEVEFKKSGYYFYSDYTVERCLYIDDVLYTLSYKKMKMNNLIDITPISEIELL